MLLVGILAVGIVLGIAKGIPAGNLTQYLTPISGLAGIAIGYFFGRNSSAPKDAPELVVAGQVNDKEEHGAEVTPAIEA
jgi:hypothetical protein